jgi:hypothetical protein
MGHQLQDLFQLKVHHKIVCGQNSGEIVRQEEESELFKNMYNGLQTDFVRVIERSVDLWIGQKETTFERQERERERQGQGR